MTRLGRGRFGGAVGSLGRHRVTLPAALALAALVAATPAQGIVGGSRDTRTDVGWVAAVMLHPDVAPGPGVDRQFCGGSLVHRRWVLTAAHCVAGGSVPPGALQVLLDQKNLNASVESEDGDLHDVKRVLVHPRYDNSDTRWDVALLQLKSGSQVRPVKVARSHPRAGTRGYVAGWGDRSSGPEDDPPENLRSAWLPIRRDAVCSASTDEWHPRSQFCAGTDGGKPDVCNGDSGSPLAIDRDPGPETRWRLVGAASSGECGVAGEYAFFARLTAPVMRDWIVQTTSSLTGG